MVLLSVLDAEACNVPGDEAAEKVVCGDAISLINLDSRFCLSRSSPGGTGKI
jgi:hypothetical protein